MSARPETAGDSTGNFSRALSNGAYRVRRMAANPPHQEDFKMANYLFAYTGGGGMAGTPEEQQKAMEAWMGWFGTLGDAVVDGGAPFGPSAVIRSDGAVSPGAPARLSGYSVVTADSLDDATSKAKGCPVLSNGGSVEIYESLPMG
jgi:hypothetical protein